MPKLVLLDGHSLAYRAFYALPSDLATSQGQVTNAAYGFTSMLIKLLGDEHPDGLAVAWDVKGGTFRNEQFPEYKAQREAPPDIFRSQVPLIEKVAQVMEVPQFGIAGYEADDVIATLAERAKADGWEVLVVTGDRDAFQLIEPAIRVMYTRRGITDTVIADAAYLNERYGITPEQYVEYAAMRGDTSDNLPGVTGVGEKTAARLLNEYGSLEEIYEHLDEMSPKLGENLAAAREQVFLNRELMALVRTVDIDVDIESLRLAEWERGTVREVFDELEFHSLWGRLLEVGGGEAAPVGEQLAVEIRSEADPERLGQLSGPIAIDPVWDGPDLAGVAVAVPDADEAVFVPAESLGGLQSMLEDPAVPKYLHDAKSTVHALLEQDIDLQGVAFDCALAAYVVNPSLKDYGLIDLAGRTLGLELEPVDEQGTPASQGTLDFGGGPDLEAAGRRVVAIGRLVEPLSAQVEARGATRLLTNIELPLVRVLARMEQAGIEVDVGYLEELGESLRDRLSALEGKIHDAAGEPFNVNSTLQLREVLFERLELPVLKKTPKGQPSTDAAVLEKLAEDHPIVELLLEFRQLEKLRSTYVDGFLPLVADDGRIHATFNQLTASTGRLSSERPNLQNIPIRSEEGRTIRRAFVAKEGCSFLVADYSQIELRILAHVTRDQGLLDAFHAGVDIHTATAARVAGIDLDAVTPDQRRRAKMINFGLLYGMEAYGLAQRLEIEREEAQEQIEAYFSQFPDVKAFMEGIVKQAHDDGYTTTIFGRRRYLPELAAANFRTRQMGERMALNAPIQGSAADIIKKAMIAIDAELDERGLSSALILQVHDELVLECPTGELEAVSALTVELMEGVAELAVPLTVDVGTGANLAETKA
ncbi:MAG: DNA polymerase I [Acidimicrobiia bacterium]|nr:DNA polymerase I [Acidimicrobiia bacterium]NNF09254.1 DNA polymerase I [Acidimicrobiia bacterium]